MVEPYIDCTFIRHPSNHKQFMITCSDTHYRFPFTHAVNSDDQLNCIEYIASMISLLKQPCFLFFKFAFPKYLLEVTRTTFFIYDQDTLKIQLLPLQNEQ